MKTNFKDVAASQSIYVEELSVFLGIVAAYHEHARSFYYNVLFADHHCPECNGRLESAGPSKGICTSCGYRIDPTLHFQRSSCCQAALIRHRLHYGCRQCGATVPSRFLFDERIFDAEYFRERVAASRARRQRTIREMQNRLTAAHTSPLLLTDLPEINQICGLTDALNELLLRRDLDRGEQHEHDDSFEMEAYRRLVLSAVHGCILHFDAVPRVSKDARTDRARRFTTLIFMEHEREIALEQQDGDILVRAYAADTKG